MSGTNGTRIDISEDVIAKIRSLPPVPVVSRKLVAAMQQETCSTAEVSRILSSDQALASQVLKLVNSSFYGLSGKVSTISHAVVILGFAAVRNLAIGLSTANVIQSVSRDHDLAEFWRHSVATAAAARVLAETAGHADAEEAFVAGLLHDLGALLIELVTEPGVYAAVTHAAADIIAVEDETFGINHAKAGQILLRHWRIPEPLCHSIRFHHHPEAYRSDPRKLTAFVAAGDLLAGAVGAGHEQTTHPTRLFDVAAFLGISLQQTGNLLGRIERAIEDTYTFLALAGVDLTPYDAAPGHGRRAVILGGNPERAGWVLGLLNRAGFQLVPLSQFLAEPKLAAAVDLVVVDAASMTREQLDRLRPVLATPSARIIAYGDASADLQAVVGHALPVLPAVFRATDLEALLLDHQTV